MYKNRFSQQFFTVSKIVRSINTHVVSQLRRKEVLMIARKSVEGADSPTVACGSSPQLTPSAALQGGGQVPSIKQPLEGETNS